MSRTGVRSAEKTRHEMTLTGDELNRRLDTLIQSLYAELAEESRLSMISPADLVRRVQPFISNN